MLQPGGVSKEEFSAKLEFGAATAALERTLMITDNESCYHDMSCERARLRQQVPDEALHTTGVIACLDNDGLVDYGTNYDKLQAQLADELEEMRLQV